ncbi:hypothetical protein BDQ17DRAFT_894126 [Cyathus striatus]|nr:hypothetical protein BDQ17DRAFT_894126 [Cyathus striatus]
MVLVTTRLLFYVTITLVLFVPIISPFLFVGWKTRKNYPFNLSSLIAMKYVKFR